MRLLREVFHAIRTRVGDDFPILLKMNGADMLPLRKGATTTELVRIGQVMQDEGIDAVEISRGHYESWPGMILSRYKGFFSGQIKEGSGTAMSRRRRIAALAAAPIVKAPQNVWRPEVKASIFHRPNCSPPNSTSRSFASAAFTRRQAWSRRSRPADATPFPRHGHSSPTRTYSRMCRIQRPVGQCAATAMDALPASAANRSTARTTRSAPERSSCSLLTRRP
jgi:hypothetical protein